MGVQSAPLLFMLWCHTQPPIQCMLARPAQSLASVSNSTRWHGCWPPILAIGKFYSPSHTDVTHRTASGNKSRSGCDMRPDPCCFHMAHFAPPSRWPRLQSKPRPSVPGSIFLLIMRYQYSGYLTREFASRVSQRAQAFTAPRLRASGSSIARLSIYP
jgi:hypothetical protein